MGPAWPAVPVDTRIHFAPAPGVPASEVAVARDGNGNGDLIAIDTNGIWQRTQTAPGADSWSGGHRS